MRLDWMMRAAWVLGLVLLAGCFGESAPLNEPNEPAPPWLIENAAQRGLSMAVGGPDQPEGLQGNVAVGDVNGDGYPDLYVAHDGPNVLFRNRGDGTFEDITAASGTADVGDGHAALFLDLDNDGLQDLLVVNRADPSRLFRNVGFGFEDITAQAGIPDVLATSAAAADVDNDGDLDIVLGTDGGLLGPRPDVLLINDGNFSATYLPEATRTRALVFCDVDMDDDPDLLAAGEPSVLWRNNGRFEREDAPMATSVVCADLTQDARPEAYFMAKDPRGPDGTIGLQVRLRNAVPLDADSDGDLDLFGVAGLMGEPDAAGPGRFMEQVHVGTFADLSAFWGNGAPGAGRGITAVDLDLDGDQDIVVLLRGELRVYENLAPQGPHVRLRLEGTASNRDAIGAKIWGEGDETRYIERVATQGTSQTSPYVHIAGEKIRIAWPSGTTQSFKDVEPGSYHLIEGGRLTHG